MRICAPFAGIVRYHVEPGQEVLAGTAIATVEATKLEAPVLTPGPGIIGQIFCDNFAAVVGGDPLAELAEHPGRSTV